MNKQIKKYFNLIKEFGFRLSFSEFILRVVGRVYGRETNIWKKLSAYKYHYINSVLKDELCDVILKYRNSHETELITIDSPIWIYWGQGLDNAPKVVQMCVDSIKKNAAKHPVILLNDNNLMSYVNISEKILEKYHEGKITIVHFSDIIRFNLLAQRGGIWCDSTLFFTKPIDCNHLCQNTFFSAKHGIGSGYLACRGLWTAFFVASGISNIMAEFVSECFSAYWDRHEFVIDYLFVDCLMYLAYENIECVHKEIDAIPSNNVQVFEAMYAFDRLDSDNEIKKIIDSCAINKLTYKVKHGEEEILKMKDVLTEFLSK